ncbi:beta-carotene 15,15'-monooxygenase [Peptoniphilus sp. MSJ-1]|uniref:Beta-carotene 15,15'-monooxygenase n=1 Tax=Peptoniphilus ovalis TaxID=2841503 RepID=A0ABS6FDU1_9FIRM|nr:beta-carotene 15,15'-monooxygenase [Peptoniphilus ovalis]MBU5668223.1 beta-carotene 15,15'-monooxygenase [Peptoniphilus ovalis]
MMKKKNIGKATRFYICRSKDVISVIILFGIMILGFEYIIYKGFLNNRGEKSITLILWTLIIGFTLIISNSMIIDLTVKDKLKNRIEFILSSGIDVKDLIKTYTFEMWRISSVSTYYLFLFTYFIYDFTRPSGVILNYISAAAMLYFEILFFNIISLNQKNFKFFKNILFFATSISIYAVGTFSENILNFLNVYDIDLIHFINAFNILFLLIFALLSFYNLKKLNNEKIISTKGEWT